MPHLFEDPNMFTDGGAVGTVTSNDTLNPNTDIQVTGTTNASTIIVQTQDWNCTASADGLVFDTWCYGVTRGQTGASNLPYEISWADLKRQNKIDDEKRKKARARARKLLKRHLTPKQWLDYDTHGEFFVKTPKGHLYQIGSARDHNIVRLNKRRKAMRVLCASIYGYGVPVEDIMLAQKLMLETQEDAFLKIAHHWPVSTAQGLRRAA